MSDPRQTLPAVHQLLAEAERAGLTADAPRGIVLDAIREVVRAARDAGGAAPETGWLAAVERLVAHRLRGSLQRVINATGVVLHTNLGRAPLAEGARLAMTGALGYSTLELDADTGRRGSRQRHVATLLCELTGAEDALVVNNAAAALLLVLRARAGDGETIVSRGELVEIGGAFRIPDILARSGSALIEVGTTNRTRLRDYQLAISPRTRLLLKVHRSNFRLAGYTTEATLTELVTLGRARAIAVVHDVGSGLLLSLEAFGLTGEPLVSESVAAGATAICSGDKLLGGPQAGIIAGPREVVQQAAADPLARALRPDKSVIAALEATLLLYREPARALRDIPTLAMLTAPAADLAQRAERLASLVAGHTVPGTSAVGGGAFPQATLPTTLVALDGACEPLLAALRAWDPPILARALDDRVVLDVRTLDADELELVADAVRALR